MEVGWHGLGTFNQSGGTNSIGINLYLGNYADSSGTYNLSGGSLYAFNELIGYNGTGVFNQTGGTNTVDSHAYIGFDLRLLERQQRHL